MPPDEPVDQIGAATTGEIAGNVHGVPIKIGWEIRGTGLWAGSLLAGGVVFYEANWRSPMSNPAHFVVTLLATFVCGILVGTAALKGRLTDALREKQEMRREMQRMAEEKGALYDRSLRQRLTSGGKPPKKR